MNPMTGEDVKSQEQMVRETNGVSVKEKEIVGNIAVLREFLKEVSSLAWRKAVSINTKGETEYHILAEDENGISAGEVMYLRFDGAAREAELFRSLCPKVLSSIITDFYEEEELSLDKLELIKDVRMAIEEYGSPRFESHTRVLPVGFKKEYSEAGPVLKLYRKVEPQMIYDITTFLLKIHRRNNPKRIKEVMKTQKELKKIDSEIKKLIGCNEVKYYYGTADEDELFA